MIFKICKPGFVLILPFFLVFISSCQSSEKKELQAENAKADSISIRLNLPELKAVNAQLLEDPNNAELYKKRALIYTSIKEYSAAVNDAKRAIKIDSNVADYYNTMVDAYFSQNNTRKAKELLETIEKKFPENTEALLKSAELYFIVRQYQKAIDYTNKALKVDPGLAKGYYIKGSIYRESGDTAKAITSLETATEQDNRYEDAFFDLGIIYAARKNNLALDYYNSALRINPNNENTLYARAKLLQDLGKIEEAIIEYKKLLEKNKNCDNCCYNLGAIYLELKKDNANAITYFNKAIDINPNYAEAFFARAYTYAKLGDKEQAKADFNTCLRLSPNYEPAVEGLNKL
jgi:pentatricopeptide repeat protein